MAGNTDQDDDILCPVVAKFINVLRQPRKLVSIVGEVKLSLHIVNVSVYDILQQWIAISSIYVTSELEENKFNVAKTAILVPKQPYSFPNSRTRSQTAVLVPKQPYSFPNSCAKFYPPKFSAFKFVRIQLLPQIFTKPLPESKLAFQQPISPIHADTFMSFYRTVLFLAHPCCPLQLCWCPSYQLSLTGSEIVHSLIRFAGSSAYCSTVNWWFHSYNSADTGLLIIWSCLQSINQHLNQFKRKSWCPLFPTRWRPEKNS